MVAIMLTPRYKILSILVSVLIVSQFMMLSKTKLLLLSSETKRTTMMVMYGNASIGNYYHPNSNSNVKDNTNTRGSFHDNDMHIDGDGGGSNSDNDIQSGSDDDNDDNSSSSSFGACILVKDDNHWLVEWLAYHYYVLPLRHLVVHIDPTSQTNPQPIFERYNNLKNGRRMKIHIWNRTYTPESLNLTRAAATKVVPHAFHRTKQNAFLQDCMRYYKLTLNWKSWIVLVDTDEFISVNNQYYNIHNNSNNNSMAPPPTDANTLFEEPGSVMKLLQHVKKQQQMTDDDNNKNENKKKCIPMYRMQMCMDENDPHHNITIPLDGGSPSSSPAKIHVSDFLTHNFVRYESDRDVKNMIDIGSIPEAYFTSDKLQLPSNSRINPIVHNPAPDYCFDNLRPGKMRILRHESPFQVYHYTGTSEQRNFRNDIRGDPGNRGGTALPSPSSEKCKSLLVEKQHPIQGGGGNYKTTSSSSDGGGSGDIRPWLSGFVRDVGYEEAARLLEGVGRVHSWPPM